MSLFETLQHRRGRVLFLSETNGCRDQMAEAFARTLGEDSMIAFSAGLHPAPSVSESARAAMAETSVSLFPDQRPKSASDFDLSGFDVIVNLSGVRLTLAGGSTLVLEPLVPSALAGDLESHRDVRGRIETFVRFLAEHFRRAKEWTPQGQVELPTAASQISPPPQASAAV